MEKRVSSISGAGKTGQKNEIRTFSNTIYKNKLKMDQIHKCKARHYKTQSKTWAEHSLT